LGKGIKKSLDIRLLAALTSPRSNGFGELAGLFQA
jgi:hypothetical protein